MLLSKDDKLSEDESGLGEMLPSRTQDDESSEKEGESGTGEGEIL
jgi:hypothetical protein